MQRLIDANAFKKENERLLHCDFPYLSEATLEELIDEALTVDAVPVIRCKDCVYFTPEKSGEHWNICRFYDAPKTAEGYCNDAEPKETGE